MKHRKTADGIEICDDTLPLFQDEEDKEALRNEMIENIRRGAAIMHDKKTMHELCEELVRQPTPSEKIEDLARELLLSGYGVTEAWRVAKAFYEERE